MIFSLQTHHSSLCLFHRVAVLLYNSSVIVNFTRDPPTMVYYPTIYIPVWVIEPTVSLDYFCNSRLGVAITFCHLVSVTLIHNISTAFPHVGLH